MPAKPYRGQWYVDVYLEVPGQGTRRLRRKSPVQTKRGAEAYERQLVQEALASSTSVPCTPEKRVADFAREWLASYVAANNKFSEAETKESILRVHLLPAFGPLFLTEVDAQRIEAYKAAKLAGAGESEPLSPKTVNNHLTVLRKMLETAHEWNALAHVPPFKWCRVPPQKFDFFAFDEAERLLGGADASWRLMLLVGLRTGLRLGELLALRWDDTDLVAGRLRVQQAAARDRVDSPKNNRVRDIPLTGEVTLALKAHRHLRGQLVFAAEGGRMFTRNETKHPLWRACKRAGLRRVGWHVLRHTFASHLAMRGAPMRAIQELMGHQSIEQTMRYAHLSPTVSRDVVGLLGPGGAPAFGNITGTGPGSKSASG